MATQRIPLDVLQKVRQYFKTILVLPESENRPQTLALLSNPDFLPEPDSLAGLGDLFRMGGPIDEGVPMPNNCGQWYVSVMDPGVAFMKLPGLQLQSGYRLATYLYRQGDDGIGKTWALPENLSAIANLEKVLVRSSGIQNPPKPLGCVDDFSLAIDGDRSPGSFLFASLLRRELEEFGYVGKSCLWSKHQLITAVPQQLQWQWRFEGAKDLSPKVRILPEGRAIVEFFTCRVTPSIAIFQHLDQYTTGSYAAQRVDRPIAIGERKRSVPVA